MKEILLWDLINLNYWKWLPQRDRIEWPFPVYGSWWITDYHNSYYIKWPWIIVWRKWTIWSVYLEKRDFFPIDTVFYVEENKNEYDIKFVYYLLKTLNLDKLNSDAAVPWLNRNTALWQKIKIPDTIELQQKIASILSKYDDLIENNNKRIKILEETAQSIYEEWFVKYNFPWSENIKMIDSGNDDFGMIPEGWEIANLVDISNTQYWYAFKSKDFNENWKWIKVIRIRNILDGETKIYSDQIVDKKYLMNNWDILVWMDWIFHIWKWVWWEANLVQRSVCFREKYDYISKNFLLLSLTPKIKYLNSVIVWTTVAHLSANDINNIKVILPSEDILKKSKKVLDDLYNLEIKLRLENQNLKETRDLLIPRLVSGELDVENLDVK